MAMMDRFVNQRPFLEVFSGRRGIRTSNSATKMKIKAKDIRRMVVACSNIFSSIQVMWGVLFQSGHHLADIT